jgi:multidrug efflux system membrane fusion protein
MKSILKVFLTIAVVVAIAGGLVWSFLVHRSELAAEAQSDEPIKNAARVTRVGQETVVIFDADTQQRMGIRTEAAVALKQRRVIAAYGQLQEDPSRSFVLRAPVAGTVQGAADRQWPDIGQNLADGSVVGALDPRLPPTDRITLNDRLASARADVESSRASLAAAQAALERARALNADNKNVSDKVVDDAKATVVSDQARLSAASESARLIEASLSSTHAGAPSLELARGGEVVEVLAHPGESVESGQPILHVARFDILLARIDVPAGQAIAAGVKTAVVAPLGYEDHPFEGERVALAASVDPKTQGQPFLFRISDPSRALRPGLSVTAYLEAPGPARSGVIVPRSAVLRQSGQTWIYVQTSSDHFSRRPVAIEESTGEGWFTHSVSAGDRIVTVGAQALLSEEFKSQIQVEDEN